MKTKTETIVRSLLARSDQIKADGWVANNAITDAADRLEELQTEVDRLRADSDYQRERRNAARDAIEKGKKERKIIEQERDQLKSEAERLRVEVESLKPYRDNHHDFLRHMARHDAGVVERFSYDFVQALTTGDGVGFDNLTEEMFRGFCREYVKQVLNQPKGDE